jgi:hypothetical protein
MKGRIRPVNMKAVVFGYRMMHHKRDVPIHEIGRYPACINLIQSFAPD